VSSPRLEAFLAELYVDADARRRFLADPLTAARSAGLDDGEADAVARIDRVGLEMAARSFAAKRRGRVRPRGGWWWRALASLTVRTRWR
jgi:hypothetical protein